MVDDASHIWKWFAQKRMQRISPFIPFDMGMEFVRNMSFGELVGIIQASIGGQTLTDELRSFLDFDLIIVAKDGGETRYLTVEIAFEAKQRHFKTAIRNARILEERSGIATLPVVASFQMNHEVQKAVDAGQIHWHYVPDHVLDSRDVEKERSIFQSDQFRRVI